MYIPLPVSWDTGAALSTVDWLRSLAPIWLLADRFVRLAAVMCLVLQRWVVQTQPSHLDGLRKFDLEG